MDRVEDRLPRELDVPRSPSSVLLLLQRSQVPPRVALADTNLSLDHLREPEVEVSAEQELQVVRNLLAAEPELSGLEVGLGYHPTTYGVWGLLLLSSRNARAAISRALGYVPLTYAFCTVSWHDEPGGGRLVFDHAEVPSDVRRFLVERDVAAGCRLVQEVAGMHVPGVGLRLATPSPSSGFIDAFGLTPVGDGSISELRIDDARLDRPLPQADEHTAAFAEAQCRQLLTARRGRAGVAGRVRALVAGSTGRMPPIDAVARELHLSERTLRRRLDAEGVAFRSLVDEVRRDLAEDLLRRKDLNVEQIGQRLGYASTSAFSNAFRRWHGIAPREYRASTAAGRQNGRRLI